MNNMRAGLVGKLASVLESVLSKLGRYDEGSVIGSILSFTVRRTSFGHLPLKTIITDLNLSFQNKHNVTGNGTGTGKQYMGFVRGNMDQITKKITDDLWVLSVMEVTIAISQQLGCQLNKPCLFSFIAAVVDGASTNAVHVADRPPGSVPPPLPVHLFGTHR